MYTIKLNYNGDRSDHICNPLMRLACREYATRTEACEAIYDALYEVIVDRRDAPKAYWVLAGDGERGTWHRIVTTPMGIKQHLTKERCGGDRWAKAVTDIYITQDDCVAGYNVETLGPDQAPEEAREDAGGMANDVIERYNELCHDYIMREGHAMADGVSAIVEEMTNA